ncbi:hypothetical protein HTZ77_37485 [Nonomuraea sp. SMC257]|uniref:Uncharacterized protein n=1 Tax=Nonomuraea montanisoli TaxID=2741721 RepID=A0A7Y6IFD5_9ACTN|nr:hypothetical protein [Nonomuraea montanisoli]NUW37056.1 hypothetical protein [Nonomuraea montanisoli]
MGWELPAQLRPIHEQFKDDAPWPDADEDDRLLRVRGWLDLADELRSTAAELDAGHDGVVRANAGGDVEAFKEKWESAESVRHRLGDGAKAADLAAVGTLMTVVFRVIWKALVVYLLTVLLVALVRAIAVTPAGGFWLTLRWYVTRRLFRSMLTEIRGNIGVVLAQTLREAMELLLISGAVPLGLIGLATWDAGRRTSWMRTDDDARREVERVLNETPRGRAALAWAREHNVTILYQPPGEGDDNVLGVYHDEYNVVEIYLRDGDTPEGLANTLIHELNHAQHRRTPDPTEMSRDAYVEAAIREEAQGNLQAYRFSEELERVRGQDLDHQSEATYDDAYSRAVRDARARREEAGGPPLTAAEERRIGERAAAEALYDELSNPEGGSVYPKSYSEDWDDKRTAVQRVWQHIID